MEQCTGATHCHTTSLEPISCACLLTHAHPHPPSCVRCVCSGGGPLQRLVARCIGEARLRRALRATRWPYDIGWVCAVLEAGQVRVRCAVRVVSASALAQLPVMPCCCRLRLVSYQAVDYNQVARECGLGLARTYNVAQIAVLAQVNEGDDGAGASRDTRICVCNSHLFWNPALAFVKTLQVCRRLSVRYVCRNVVGDVWCCRTGMLLDASGPGGGGARAPAGCGVRGFQ